MDTSSQEHKQCVDITRVGAVCQLKVLLTILMVAVDL